jgi:predicted ATPase
MRIGIHTGLVVLGPLGRTGEFAATGDTVNVANRLQESAPVGGVLISHETYRHVYGSFDVQNQPPLTLKGKAEPFQTYSVLRARPRSLARTLRGVEGLGTEMIGRESELGRLQSAFQELMEEREVQLLTIVGEAGIGKSRLLMEFQKWLEALPERIRFFHGRATEEMGGLPFALIRDVFASRFDIQESDPPAVAREKLQNGILNLQGASTDAPIPSIEEYLFQAHFIGQLLGLDFSGSPYLRDLLHDREQIRQRAFHYMQQFFTALTERPASAALAEDTKATVLVLEDIHLSDDGSLDLIADLARNCQAAPLMIVSLARLTLFERRPAWGEGLTAHTRMDLEPLSRRDSRKLVETLLHKAPKIPRALRDLIVDSAEGNPFYIEEMIKMLIDRRVILTEGDEWRIEPRELAAAQVPSTLTGVLQARLDSLTPIERAVLQRASVVGRVFWDTAIDRLSCPDETAAAAPARETTLEKREVQEALAALRHKQLVFRRECSSFAGSVEYTFKHELLRSVTYESVLKKLRRGHHARVAEWLIAQSGERIGEYSGLVAAHFEQAGRIVEAADWYGRAGRQARMAHAPLTAIESFRKALELSPAQKENSRELEAKRLEWHEGLGETLGAQARFSEAAKAFEHMRRLAENLGDAIAQARALNGMAYLHERQGENRASIQKAERAEELARNAGEAGRGVQIRALYLKGWAHYRIGESPAVLKLAEQTLKLCTESADRNGMVASLKLFGVAHLHLGQFPEAERYFQEGLQLCREIRDRRNEGAMWSNLGESARLRGDYKAAADLYQKALTVVRQIGNRDSETIYLNNLSGALLGLRQYAPAESMLRTVIAQTASPNWCTLSETYRFLSEACLGQGKLPEALTAAQRALELAKESENGLDVGAAWRALGRIGAKLMAAPVRKGGRRGAARAADAPEPGNCFRESLRVFKEMKAEAEQARTLRAWSRFDFTQGRETEGMQKAVEAQNIFTRLRMPLAADRKDTWL